MEASQIDWHTAEMSPKHMEALKWLAAVTSVCDGRERQQRNDTVSEVVITSDRLVLGLNVLIQSPINLISHLQVFGLSYPKPPSLLSPSSTRSRLPSLSLSPLLTLPPFLPPFPSLPHSWQREEGTEEAPTPGRQLVKTSCILPKDLHWWTVKGRVPTIWMRSCTFQILKKVLPSELNNYQLGPSHQTQWRLWSSISSTSPGLRRNMPRTSYS